MNETSSKTCSLFARRGLILILILWRNRIAAIAGGIGQIIPLAAHARGWNTGRVIIPAIFLATILDQLRHDHWGWTALGFAAQGLFSMRFLIQWLASEKQKKFVMPIQFWHFSIIGGSLNLVYSLHLWKAPLIFGAVASLFTSTRSFMLHRRGIAAEKNP